jgi:hypothetical protein
LSFGEQQEGLPVFDFTRDFSRGKMFGKLGGRIEIALRFCVVAFAPVTIADLETNSELVLIGVFV